MNFPFRVGFGYDIHQLVTGRDLVLGGVLIPHHKGLKGHSDGDCLSHAIADALLGALGLPDIGFYFPPTDSRIEGINSQLIIQKAVEEVRRLGFGVVNVDSTVIAEEPKIAPYREAMIEALAKSLGVSKDRINVKATTNETIDDIGNGKGIAAHAVCMLGEI